MTFHEQLAVATVPCRDKQNDPNWWFGDSEDPDEKYNNAERERAVALCGDCPLITVCLTNAITQNEQYGVWGGATPAQRQHMKSRGWR